MHLPVGGEERVDVVLRKEIRCTMRAVQNGDIPAIDIVRQQRSRQTQPRFRNLVLLRRMKHVAHAQGTSRMTAEAAEGESCLCAEIVGNVETPSDREIGAQPRTGDAAEFQHGAGFDCIRAP